MKEELTTAMHSEFAVSAETDKRHTAFAVFQLVSDRITLDRALYHMNRTLDEVRPYIAEWNRLSPKQIILE